MAVKRAAFFPLYAGIRVFPYATTLDARGWSAPSSSQTIADPVCPVAPITTTFPNDAAMLTTSSAREGPRGGGRGGLGKTANKKPISCQPSGDQGDQLPMGG